MGSSGDPLKSGTVPARTGWLMSSGVVRISRSLCLLSSVSLTGAGGSGCSQTGQCYGGLQLREPLPERRAMLCQSADSSCGNSTDGYRLR